MSKSVKRSSKSREAHRKGKPQGVKGSRGTTRAGRTAIKVEQILTDTNCKVRTAKKPAAGKSTSRAKRPAVKIITKQTRQPKRPAQAKKSAKKVEVTQLLPDVKPVKVGAGKITTKTREAKTNGATAKTARKPVAKKSIQAKKSTKQPKSVSVVEAPAELPKIIIHTSKMITGKSDLPTEPEPIIVSKKQPEIIISPIKSQANNDTRGETQKKITVTEIAEGTSEGRGDTGKIKPAPMKLIEATSQVAKQPRSITVKDAQDDDKSATQEQSAEIKSQPAQPNGQQGAQQQVQSRSRQQAQPKSQQQVQTIDMKRVHARMERRLYGQTSTPRQQPTSREIKDQAIERALATASRPAPARKTRQRTRVSFGFRRVVLALACTAAIVFAIVYFVGQSSSDISLKVAAMQTGIDASYPSYVPRDYSLSDITSENGKVILNFKNTTSGGAFSIVEENSSWDTNALLENYVKETYGDNYSVIVEQGLTLYVSGSDASWVNGGVVYKLKTTSGSLTKKQIKAIAVSL